MKTGLENSARMLEELAEALMLINQSFLIVYTQWERDSKRRQMDST